MTQRPLLFPAIFINAGNNKTATVRASVRACVRTESDLRDGWTESDDLLESDGESPDTGARLLKFRKISILAE